jgi:hypothetical protein
VEEALISASEGLWAALSAALSAPDAGSAGSESQAVIAAALHALLQLAVTFGSLVPLVLAANGLYHTPRALLASAACRDIAYAVHHALEEMRHWNQILTDIEVGWWVGSGIYGSLPCAVLHSLFPPPLPLTRTQVAEISGQPIAAVSPEAVFARTRFANDKSLSVGIAADGKSAKSSSAGNSYAILGTPCGQVCVWRV